MYADLQKKVKIKKKVRRLATRICFYESQLPRSLVIAYLYHILGLKNQFFFSKTFEKKLKQR